MLNISYGDSVSCALEPLTGICRGFFEKFFFNSATAKCESFVYGGSGGISLFYFQLDTKDYDSLFKGNDNRFDTLEQCQQGCLLNKKINIWCHLYLSFSLFPRCKIKKY